MAAINIIDKSQLTRDLRLDPEIYHPVYQSMLNGLIKIKSRTISSFQPILDRGKLPLYIENGDVGVIKSAKIKNGFIDEVDEFTNSAFIKNFPDAEANYGDILINSTGRGTLGRSAILTEKSLKYIIDGHVTKISCLRGISEFYVSVYLLSRFGYKQLDTMARGSSGQTEIYPEDIGNVLMPVLSSSVITKINNLCKDLYQQSKTTKNYYFEAEEELLNRLEFKRIDINHILGYVVSSKNILENGRTDPEFYQPKFEHLLKQLREAGAKKLSEFCQLPNRGVQPLYVDQGDIIVVNSKHLGRTEIDIENSEHTSEFFYEESTTKAKLQQYDVLMYSTGAYIGRTNVYLENLKAIASNHVTIIRPDSKVCNPVYLALFLNSPAGLMQTDQRASGSAQREIYPQDISEYQVFIPQNKDGKSDLTWQNKLADKVVQANQAKKEAKQKLQEARKLVEREVDKMLGGKGVIR